MPISSFASDDCLSHFAVVPPSKSLGELTKLAIVPLQVLDTRQLAQVQISSDASIFPDLVLLCRLLFKSLQPTVPFRVMKFSGHQDFSLHHSANMASTLGDRLLLPVLPESSGASNLPGNIHTPHGTGVDAMAAKDPSQEKVRLRHADSGQLLEMQTAAVDDATHVRGINAVQASLCFIFLCPQMHAIVAMARIPNAVTCHFSQHRGL